MRSKGPFTAAFSACILRGTGGLLSYSFPISLNFPETTLKCVVPFPSFFPMGSWKEEREQLTKGSWEHWPERAPPARWEDRGSFSGRQVKLRKINQSLSYPYAWRGGGQIPTVLEASLALCGFLHLSEKNTGPSNIWIGQDLRPTSPGVSKCFLKGPDSKNFRRCWPQHLHCNDSAAIEDTKMNELVVF